MPLLMLACALSAAAGADASAAAPPAPAMRLHWMAPFLSGGGYCSEATEFVLGLQRNAGTAAARIQVTAEQHGDSIDMEYVQGMDAGARALLRTVLTPPEPTMAPSSFFVLEGAADAAAPPLVAVCHSEPGAWNLPRPNYMTSLCPPPNSAFVVGRTMFETDRLPEGWVDRLAHPKMDEVWVPTSFAARIFFDAGVPARRVKVVGEPVDVHFYDPERWTALPLPSAGARTFKFVSVFKWEERKGWAFLLRAYLEEFSGRDDVVLYLLCRKYHDATPIWSHIDGLAREQRGAAWRDIPDAPKLVVLDPLPQSELARLYKAADAFVLPSRGEGWGRPHVEAMSMQLPIIATNWSGPTEFMTEENSYPLPIDGMDAIPANRVFGGHLWARPSVAALRQLMRRVSSAEGREEGRRKGLQARRDMVERFSPEVMAALILSHAERIATSFTLALAVKKGEL